MSVWFVAVVTHTVTAHYVLFQQICMDWSHWLSNQYFWGGRSVDSWTCLWLHNIFRILAGYRPLGLQIRAVTMASWGGSGDSVLVSCDVLVSRCPCCVISMGLVVPVLLSIKHSVISCHMISVGRVISKCYPVISVWYPCHLKGTGMFCLCQHYTPTEEAILIFHWSGLLL